LSCQRFEQARLLICRRTAERSPPHSQRRAHLCARRLERGDLIVDRFEHALAGGAHRVTRFAAAVANAEKAGDLGQREAEPLRISHQREPIEHAVRVLPVTGRRSCRLRQQAEALVVPDGIAADAAGRGDRADREEWGSHDTMIAAA
jgi:hypothetical protein